MKNYRKFCLILCFLLLLSPVLSVKAAENDPAVITGCSGLDAAAPIGGSVKLTDTANAAILYERSTGTMVYAYRPDERIYPSSMVKLMTAIVALENGDLEENVTVTRSALESMGIGVISVKLQRGETMSLKDLLYCLMVASANDAATVLAEHIGGSQSGFVAMMNEKARELGCTDTNFTNAHGLHDENCYTTARDILKILEYGMNNEHFRTMFETVEYTVAATNKSGERQIRTTNSMCREAEKKYYDDRVIGGKTGATDAAGRCLTVTAKVGDMELVGIVMGADAAYSEDGSVVDRNYSFLEMSELLDHAESNFECRQLYYEDQVIAQYPVENGRNNVVTRPIDSGFCVVPKDIKIEEIVWKYAQNPAGLTAPVEAGQPISTMEVWYRNVCLASTELVAINGVAVYEPYEEPKGATDMKNEKDHGKLLAQILGIVLAVVIVAVVGMFLLRIARIAMIRVRIRRRRRNRRRNRNARME